VQRAEAQLAEARLAEGRVASLQQQLSAAQAALLRSEHERAGLQAALDTAPRRR